MGSLAASLGVNDLIEINVFLPSVTVIDHPHVRCECGITVNYRILKHKARKLKVTETCRKVSK